MSAEEPGGEGRIDPDVLLQHHREELEPAIARDAIENTENHFRTKFDKLDPTYRHSAAASEVRRRARVSGASRGVSNIEDAPVR